MQTVAQPRTTIKHYAYFGDDYGTAELVNGSGYLFRKDGEKKAVLVDYRNADLLLLGHVPTADAQMAVDGDRVRTCSRTLAA